MATPTLTKMGIEYPDEIVRYETMQKSSRKDVLRIFYKRKEGSLRPVRRTYEFGRGLQMDVVDSGQPIVEQRYEVSPEYLAAVQELDVLLQNDDSRSARIIRLTEQMDELQKRIDAGDAGSDLGARFRELRAEIGGLF